MQEPAAPALAGHEAGAAQWSLLPDSITPDMEWLQPDGNRELLFEGLRLVDGVDGSVTLSEQAFPTPDVTAAPLPERLGGGYVFSSNVASDTLLWRAGSWTGRAEPLATLGERVHSLVPGFDRLYVLLGEPRELNALDLQRRASTDLGALPECSSYRALAFADAWFGVVDCDVRGVLASFDAGTSWHALGIFDADVALQVSGDSVSISSSSRRLLLSPDGELADASELPRGANTTSTDANGESTKQLGLFQPLGERPLREAVLYGWPESRAHAVVLTRGTLARVSLPRGRVLEYNADAYAGNAPCPALQLGEGVGFVCSEVGLGTQVFALGPNLTLRRVAAFGQPRQLTLNGAGYAVIHGPCADVSQTDQRATFCVVDDVSRREVEFPNASDSVETARVAALKDGAVALLEPPATGSGGTLSVWRQGRIDSVPLQAASNVKLPQLVARGLWLQNVSQLPSGSLGAWVVSGFDLLGVEVALDGKLRVMGHAEREEGDLARTLFAGARALAVSSSGVGWLSEDNGATWRKIALPRGLDPHRPHQPSALSGAPTLGCSAVGCVYEPWVRIGFGGAESERDKSIPLVDVAVRTSLSAPAYSALRATCYETGLENAVDGRLRQTLETAANGSVRHGAASGFTKGLPQNPAEVDVFNGAFRRFWSVAAPKHSADELVFDMGHETPVDFRAYVRGPRAESWPRQSAWLVRVAPRFGAEPVWSTAPTRAPWAEWIVAAQTFGSDRANRAVPDWTLVLDTEERAGLLRVATRNHTELHWLEADKPALSLGGLNLPKAVAVAKHDGAALVLVPRDSELELYRLSSQELRLLQRYPFGGGSNVNLIHTNDGSRLAIWVQSAKGAWFIHPLNSDFSPSEPLVIGASSLNQRALACPEDASGWLVRANVPLSRVSESDSSSLLTFAGGRAALTASDVDAKVIVGQGAPCVVELAAKLESPWSAAIEKSDVPTSATIPLSLRDSDRNTHHVFRCEL